MGSDVMLWAGKRLTDEEEATTRRLVGVLRRAGDEDGADALARFLPESAHAWTPDELELGAHAGPWLSFEGRLEAGEAG
jgi:hypothetical protein